MGLRTGAVLGHQLAGPGAETRHLLDQMGHLPGVGKARRRRLDRRPAPLRSVAAGRRMRRALPPPGHSPRQESVDPPSSGGCTCRGPEPRSSNHFRSGRVQRAGVSAMRDRMRDGARIGPIGSRAGSWTLARGRQAFGLAESGNGRGRFPQWALAIQPRGRCLLRSSPPEEASGSVGGLRIGGASRVRKTASLAWEPPASAGPVTKRRRRDGLQGADRGQPGAVEAESSSGSARPLWIASVHSRRS